MFTLNVYYSREMLCLKLDESTFSYYGRRAGTSKTSNSILNSTRGIRGNRRVDSLGAQTAHFDLLDWCTPNESIRDKRLSLAVSLYVLEVFSR